MKQFLQHEELAKDYVPLSDSLANNQAVDVSIMKRDNMTGPQNPELRVLCIAAYLRCLYAAIEYAPTEEMKESAIEQISDDVRMRELT